MENNNEALGLFEVLSNFYHSVVIQHYELFERVSSGRVTGPQTSQKDNEVRTRSLPRSHT